MKTLAPINISFEFFPPKTIDGANHLSDAVKTLADYHPQFLSVTFGAGGSTRDGTIDTVKMLQRISKCEVAPHLSCVGASEHEIVEILDRYKQLGIKRIVALRGDLPSGMGQAGEFKFASELIPLIRREMGDEFNIVVAAYPEIHPQALNAEDDLLNLKRKFDAGATSAITQYFFNADSYAYLLDDCARVGINMPIIPGIMPITQFAKLARFSDMCGAEIPRWIRKRLESYGDDIESIKKFGIEVVHHLCTRLVSAGAPGLHFYTLNHAEGTEALLQLMPGLKQKTRFDPLSPFGDRISLNTNEFWKLNEDESL